MPPTTDSRRALDPLERAVGWIELLAEEVGPRRPTSRSERLAALLMREELRRASVEARLEPFRGYASFGYPFGAIQAAAILPSLLPASLRRTRSIIALAAASSLAAEGSLRWRPVSRALARHESANLVATIEPAGAAARTLCISCHLDSSRSGLIFHPRLVGMLGRWIAVQSAAALAQGPLEALAGGSARGRRALLATRSLLAAGLAVLVERELRGEDVPGANDNASGCAVAATLAGEIAARPLESTRTVLLMTGCEESGTLGMEAFLDRRDTDGWLFLNFDNVAGDGSVRFLTREGVISKWDADPELVDVAADVADRRPELRMAAEPDPAGLTYDSSPVLARGGRAMTISVQDGSLPNLHWPTDTLANVDRGGVGRTIEAGRELVRAIDAGGADGG